MDCALASTGLDLGYLLAIAGLIVLGGVLLVLFARRRRAAQIGLLAVVLIALGVCAPTSMPAAQAATSCVVDPGPGPGTPLTITQTSSLSNISLGAAPIAISGQITNNTTDDTFITQVVVSISSVVKAAGAAAGVCDATDYVLVAPVMPVGQALPAGTTINFSGASLGFVNKATNQDACQGATVFLLYTVS